MRVDNTTPGDEMVAGFVGFCLICITYGLALGAVALGAGLTCLTVVQGIGFGILGFGAGTLYGFTFGAKSIISSIADTVVERIKDRQTRETEKWLKQWQDDVQKYTKKTLDE